MSPIDWLFVARNALWILGLSVVLAAWSYTSWWASVRRVRARRAVGFPIFQVPFSAGMILFATGLAWGATMWWERGAWIILGVAFVWQFATGWRAAARNGWGPPYESPQRPHTGEADGPADGIPGAGPPGK